MIASGKAGETCRVDLNSFKQILRAAGKKDKPIDMQKLKDFDGNNFCKGKGKGCKVVFEYKSLSQMAP